METKHDTPQSAAEVISRAMEIWGPDGDHWCQFSLRKGDLYCLIGAMSQAAYGKTSYAHLQDYHLHPKAKRTVLSEAYRYVEARLKNHPTELPSVLNSMVGFNDTHSFPEVKALMCNALKDALADETKETL